MLRLFDRHYIRRCEELDGMWSFSVPDLPALPVKTAPVPGAWEQIPGLEDYRGNAVYEREIHVREAGYLRLVFKGVSHTAELFFDGQQIAHHYNAYTPFDAAVYATEGLHRIRVEVNNTFGAHSALHKPNDYYTYGGITRPVALEYIPGVFLRLLHFLPRFDEAAGVWSAHICAVVQNVDTRPHRISVRGELADLPLAFGEATVGAGERVTLETDAAFPGVTPWSHEQPRLYLLRATLTEDGRECDDLIERVGFRTCELRGHSFYLNGKKTFLQGFNRHEDYATVGCAIPLQLMVRDMDLMQDMGVNALRTCHYPNDERFLDLCDERGIMVWEENHARGLYLPDMQHPLFEEQCRDCIDEMIENHFNHPSIVIWGLLNECASDTEEGRAMYARQYEQIRSLDRSRPVTSASCRYYTDICLDLPDIVSFNIYSGWYFSNPVKDESDKMIDWIGTAGGKDKPIIYSEFGGAAIYGYRDPGHAKWSEERQADILDETLAVYMHDERITGVFIWQFCDCRVTSEGDWFQSRVREHNNKGVVDEYRRPKLAYQVVRRRFLEKAEEMKG